MTDTEADLSPLGKLLEAARLAVPLSKREAARRSGFSEARWRQIVSGLQNPRDPESPPARPRSATVVAAARAVGVDAADALAAAGLDPAHASALSEPFESDDDEAIRRILLADIPVDRKQAIIKLLIAERIKANERLRNLVDEQISDAQDRG